MKKILITLTIITVLTSFSACAVDGGQAEGPVQTTANTEDDQKTTKNEEAGTPLGTDGTEMGDGSSAFSIHDIEFELYERGAYYELYGQVQGTATYYRIFNEDLELIDFGYYEKSGSISQIGDMLVLSLNGGMFSQIVRYYDIQNSRISCFFNAPLAVNEELVVYVEGQKFVIQNIFDPAAFYQEIEMDPIPGSALQFEVCFIDNQHLQVKYPTEDGEAFSQIYAIGQSTKTAGGAVS